MVLRGDPRDSKRDQREAGYFTSHFCSRAGRASHWLAYANSANIRLQGATDHLASVAPYLADPEGNGSEIYVDKSRRDGATKPTGQDLAQPRSVLTSPQGSQ